jgi:hypothetical protein
VLNPRTKAKGGGVAFYLKEDIPHKVIQNLTMMLDKEFECLTIEATINNCKCILSNTDRPPNCKNMTNSEHVSLFIDHLDNHLNNLSLSNKNTFVFLDSNINQLTLNNNVNSQRYLETLYSNGFSQKIGKATHISGQTFSLIDHVLTKTKDVNICAGPLLTDISDHFMNFICINVPVKKKTQEFVPQRNMTKSNIDNFKNNLRNLHWANVLNSNDVNESFTNFWDDFSS